MINKYTATDYGEVDIPYGSIAGVVRDFILKEMGVDCAAIYIYLYDKGPTYEPWEGDILKNIKGLTRDRYQAAIRLLKKHGFWVTLQERKEKGKFGAKKVDFFAFPEHFLTESWDSGLAGENTGLEGCSEGVLELESDECAHRKLDLPTDGKPDGRIIQPQIHKELNKHKELLTHDSSYDSSDVGNGFFGELKSTEENKVQKTEHLAREIKEYPEYGYGDFNNARRRAGLGANGSEYRKLEDRGFCDEQGNFLRTEADLGAWITKQAKENENV